jgi:acetyltransferase-like isoleucine patch superfamily enzyme
VSKLKKNRGRERFKSIKPFIVFAAKALKVFPKKIRIKMFYRARNYRGSVGLLYRYVVLKTIALSVGDNVFIGEMVYILNPEKLVIGDNVSIHSMSYLECIGGVEIGNDVSIAHSVTIMSVNHNFKSIEVPIKDQGISCKGVKINDDVWIGAKVTILDGIVIQKGSVIAANAVVTKDIEQNSIYAGVPAVKIKDRV